MSTFEDLVRAALASVDGSYSVDPHAQAAAAEQLIRQQQWQRGHANPFTQAPAVRSAVAAEAYQGAVIEGTSRRVESA